MPIKLENISGNGSILPNSIFSYSYSEEVSSLEPSNISGATSQVNVSAIAVESEATDSHADSKLLINNEMSFTDSLRGVVNFRVKNISKNLAAVSITGETIESRLNVERTAAPHGGEGSTLLTAINYYCGLVDIEPLIEDEFADELDLVPVNFMGWKSIVWEKLKELCAGFSASVDENVGIEMVINESDLVFRKAKQNVISLQRELSNESINIESFDTARSVRVVNYNTSYGTNKVFYEVSNFDESKEKQDRFQSSISDSMQVEAGATLRKRFTVNATFETINQPVCVEQIDRDFPDPYEGTTGQFVIVGIDDLPIEPEQWNENGGSLTVELIDENGEPLPPGEIELVIKAPKLTGLPKASDPNEIAFAPYKIGVESSGEAEYPALWLTGTGVFYEKKEKLFLTGSSNEYTSKAEGPTVDNIFITNDFNATSRGLAAAQANCGPKITLSQEMFKGFTFSDDIGSLQTVGLNQYRINTANFSESSISITSSALLSIDQWNSIWTDATFEDFGDTVLNPDLFPEEALKFNEFSIIPRIGA
jgi:hypothetical protein